MYSTLKLFKNTAVQLSCLPLTNYGIREDTPKLSNHINYLQAVKTRATTKDENSNQWFLLNNFN